MLSDPDGAQTVRSPESTGASRIVVIDAIRGLALVGMILFHFDWDLADFGYVQTPPTASAAWTALGQAVATAFLGLSGVGLVLGRAHGAGPALRRLAVIAGSAAAVTLVTAWLFPQDVVTFGILHCIAVTNAIALVLLDAPLWALLLSAAAALAAPGLLSSAWTEGPLWWWLGVSPTLPRTLDYRPVLPWLGVVLLGVSAARTLPLQALRTLRGDWLRPLAFAGRHSLVVYLIHQPVLFGILSLVNLWMPADRLSDFVPACQRECQAAGAGVEGCRAACLCAARQVAGEAGASSSNPTEEVVRSCLPSRPPAPSPSPPQVNSGSP